MSDQAANARNLSAETTEANAGGGSFLLWSNPILMPVLNENLNYAIDHP